MSFYIFTNVLLLPTIEGFDRAGKAFLVTSIICFSLGILYALTPAKE
jgi:hypothetical protein